ncbi:MAG: AAA family ATPase [Hyphomonadaceae bacterium]
MSNAIKRGLTFLEPGRYDDLRPAFDFIPGTLQDNSVGIIYGPPGSGKTFYAIHLLACAATGRAVFGETPEKRTGLYIGLEGEAGVKARLKAWCAHNGVESSPVHYALGSFDIIEKEQRAVLIDYLRQHKIQFVVIDTLSKAMTGADENTAAEMSPIIDALHEIKSYTQACVVAIAHSGKDQRAGIRGWSGQLGNADTAIEIEAHIAQGEVAQLSTLRSAYIRKQRDGEAGQRRAFRLQRYDTDQMDERGKPVASVALCEGEFTDAEISEKLDNPLSKRDREALAILAAMTADARLLGAPDVDSLRKRLKAEGWGPDNPASWRSAFNRFVAKLEEDSNGELSYH